MDRAIRKVFDLRRRNNLCAKTIETIDSIYIQIEITYGACTNEKRL